MKMGAPKIEKNGTDKWFSKLKNFHYELSINRNNLEGVYIKNSPKPNTTSGGKWIKVNSLRKKKIPIIKLFEKTK